MDTRHRPWCRVHFHASCGTAGTQRLSRRADWCRDHRRDRRRRRDAAFPARRGTTSARQEDRAGAGCGVACKKDAASAPRGGSCVRALVCLMMLRAVWLPQARRPSSKALWQRSSLREGANNHGAAVLLAQHVYQETPMKTTKHSGAQSEDFGRPRHFGRLTLPGHHGLQVRALIGARAGSILKQPECATGPASSIHVDRAHAIPHPFVFIIAVSEVRRVA